MSLPTDQSEFTVANEGANSCEIISIVYRVNRETLFVDRKLRILQSKSVTNLMS